MMEKEYHHNVEGAEAFKKLSQPPESYFGRAISGGSGEIITVSGLERIRSIPCGWV